MVEAANRAELIYRDEFVGRSHRGGGQTFVAVQSTKPFLIDFDSGKLHVFGRSAW